MIEYEDIEKHCLEHLEIDFMPLNDVVREFSGFDKEYPSENEFMNSLDFISYFIDKHNLRCLVGSEMKPLEKSTSELINWLKEEWTEGNFDNINYGVWFDRKE
jgi:hypothetical protein